MSEPAATISDSDFYLKIITKYRRGKRNLFPEMIFCKSSNSFLSQNINMDIVIKLNFHQWTFSSWVMKNMQGLGESLLRSDKQTLQNITKSAIVKNKKYTDMIVRMFSNASLILSPGRRNPANNISIASFTRSLFTRFERLILYISKSLRPFFLASVADLYPQAEHYPTGDIVGFHKEPGSPYIIINGNDSYAFRQYSNVFLNIRIQHTPQNNRRVIWQNSESPDILSDTSSLNIRMPARPDLVPQLIYSVHSTNGTARINTEYRNHIKSTSPAILIKSSSEPLFAGRYQFFATIMREKPDFNRWLLISRAVNSYYETYQKFFLTTNIFREISYIANPTFFQHEKKFGPRGIVRLQQAFSDGHISKQGNVSYVYQQYANEIQNLRIPANRIHHTPPKYYPPASGAEQKERGSQQTMRNLSGPDILSDTGFSDIRIHSNPDLDTEIKYNIYPINGTVKLNPYYWNHFKIISPVTLIKSVSEPWIAGRYQFIATMMREKPALEAVNYWTNQNPAAFIKPVLSQEHKKFGSDAILIPKKGKDVPTGDDIYYFQNHKHIEQAIETVKNIAQEAKEAAKKETIKAFREADMKRQIDINRLSDQVYQNIERRLRSERERRGL